MLAAMAPMMLGVYLMCSEDAEGHLIEARDGAAVVRNARRFAAAPEAATYDKDLLSVAGKFRRESGWDIAWTEDPHLLAQAQPEKRRVVLSVGWVVKSADLRDERRLAYLTDVLRTLRKAAAGYTPASAPAPEPARQAPAAASEPIAGRVSAGAAASLEGFLNRAVEPADGKAAVHARGAWLPEKLPAGPLLGPDARPSLAETERLLGIPALKSAGRDEPADAADLRGLLSFLLSDEESLELLARQGRGPERTNELLDAYAAVSPLPPGRRADLAALLDAKEEDWSWWRPDKLRDMAKRVLAGRELMADLAMAHRLHARFFPAFYRALPVKLAFEEGGVNGFWKANDKEIMLTGRELPLPGVEDALGLTTFGGRTLMDRRLARLLTMFHEYAHALFWKRTGYEQRARDSALDAIDEGFAVTLELLAVDKALAAAAELGLSEADARDLSAWKRARLADLRKRDRYTEGTLRFWHGIYKSGGEEAMLSTLDRLAVERLAELPMRHPLFALAGGQPQLAEAFARDSRLWKEWRALGGYIADGRSVSDDLAPAALAALELVRPQALDRFFESILKTRDSRVISPINRSPLALAQLQRLAGLSPAAADRLVLFLHERLPFMEPVSALWRGPEWVGALIRMLAELPMSLDQRADFIRLAEAWLAEPPGSDGDRQAQAAAAESLPLLRQESGLDPGLLSLVQERQAAGLPDFRNIVIDVRDSRGGNGDVAAGYLTALELLARAARAREPAPLSITFLMDKTAQEILGGLLGRDVSPGREDRAGGARLAFHTPRSLPESFPAADLYLALATPSGVERVDGGLGGDLDGGVSANLSYRGPGLSADAGLPIDERTVILAQTVLGNTENPRHEDSAGLVQVGRRRTALATAGLGPGESGIYSDQVAWSLRGQGGDAVSGFLAQALDSVKDRRARGALRRLLKGEALAGAAPGLVYGIHSQEQKDQFQMYLSSLASRARKTGESFVLISPSAFSEDDIKTPSLREQIRILQPGQVLPEQAERGQVYVLCTGGLPHPVFVGLMAYARPPPLIAGDGALSAAVILGRPFVMTEVQWNENNVRNLRKRLLEHEDRPEVRELIRDVYSVPRPGLDRSLELAAYPELYQDLAHRVPDLTDSILTAAAKAAAQARLSAAISPAADERGPAAREPAGGLDRPGLDAVFAAPRFEPAALIEELRKDPFLRAQYDKGVGVWEGYSLQRHTLMVLGQFEKYFRGGLPGGVDRDFFRLVLALHDIGKPRAVEAGDKRRQHEFTREIVKDYLGRLGFEPGQTALALALLDADPIGRYVKGGEVEPSAGRIAAMAEGSGLPAGEFFKLLLTLYMVDASSYTEDAGGTFSLDGLFVFDPLNHVLRFSPDIERSIAALGRRLGEPL